MCQQIFAQSDYYWVGGTGSWSDLNHWRIGSATGPQATIIPSRYDNVFFLNGSGVVSGTSGTCKDFTMDNSFSGQVSFGYNALDVYGNFKWGANATLNCTNLNLYSEGTNPTPAIVDVANPFRVDYTASLAINFLGTGSFNLLNDFSAIAYNGSFPSGGAARVSFNIKDSAVLMTNNKNISVYAGFNYSSTIFQTLERPASLLLVRLHLIPMPILRRQRLRLSHLVFRRHRMLKKSHVLPDQLIQAYI